MPPVRTIARPVARAAAVTPRPVAKPVATRTAPRPVAAATRPVRGNGQTAGFVFDDYDDDPDEVTAAHATQQTGTFDNYLNSSFPQFKPREGENTLRIMPRTFDFKALKVDKHWALKIALHYDVGADGVAYLCPNKMHGEPCVLCDERRALGDDQEALRAMRPGNRYIAWVIDRNNEGIGPQVWSMPVSLEKEICGRSKVKRTGAILKISNPTEGYDFSFNREGTGINTKYPGLDISRDPSPLHDDPKIVKKWGEYIKANPLDTVLNFYDQAYIAQVYSGSVERADALDPEKPARGTRKNGKVSEVIDDEIPEETEAAELDADSILGMEEEELEQVCADNGMTFDMADYENIEHARESVMLALFPEAEAEAEAEEDTPFAEDDEVEPEEEQEPAPTTPRGVKGRLPTKTVVAAKLSARVSPAEQAKSRIAAMRKKG